MLKKIVYLSAIFYITFQQCMEDPRKVIFSNTISMHRVSERKSLIGDLMGQLEDLSAFHPHILKSLEQSKGSLSEAQSWLNQQNIDPIFKKQLIEQLTRAITNQNLLPILIDEGANEGIISVDKIFIRNSSLLTALVDDSDLNSEEPLVLTIPSVKIIKLLQDLCTLTFIHSDNEQREEIIKNYLKKRVSGTKKFILLWHLHKGAGYLGMDYIGNLVDEVIYEEAGYTPQEKIINFNDISYAQKLSPKGTYIAVAIGDKIQIFDTKTLKSIQTFAGHTKEIVSLAFSADEKYLASGSWDHTIKVWDLESGNVIYTLYGHSRQISVLAFSPGGSYLASGSRDNTIRLWNLKLGLCNGILVGHTNSIRSLVFNAEKDILISGYDDATIKLWDYKLLQGVKCSHTLKGHTGYVSSLAVSSQGNYLISGAWDNTIRLWDIQSLNCITTIKTNISIRMASMDCVDFINDNLGVSMMTDRKVQLWDLQSGKCIKTITCPGFCGSYVAWHPTNSFLVCASSTALAIYSLYQKNNIKEILINILKHALAIPEEANLLLNDQEHEIYESCNDEFKDFIASCFAQKEVADEDIIYE